MVAKGAPLGAHCFVPWAQQHECSPLAVGQMLLDISYMDRIALTLNKDKLKEMGRLGDNAGNIRSVTIGAGATAG